MKFGRSINTAGALIGVAVLLTLIACDDRAVLEDYSGFNRFEFEQQAGLGFCPDPEAVFSTAIEHSGPDQFTLTTTSLRLSSPGNEGDCAIGVDTSSGCMVAETRAPRPLSGEEVAQLRAAFAKLEVHPEPDRKCRSLGIDPCVIRRFTWDGAEHSDFVCSEDRLPPQQAQALVDLLNDLRDAG